MSTPRRIDSHVHVGLRGDRWPDEGRLSDSYRKKFVFQVFLKYARIAPDKAYDTELHAATVRTISTCGLDAVVCLALDPVFDSDGNEQKDASHVWVSNEYILRLRREIGPKVLFGASVHPYDPDFEARVREYVDNGAVLIKWLPSAQQIDLADERVAERLKFLATAKKGRPLPLLLHVGPEYAIPSTDETTRTYDYLSWSWRERLMNSLRGKRKWRTPRINEIHQNLRVGLEAGAVIIFAHCGTPYYTSGILSKLFEHSDFDVVCKYIRDNKHRSGNGTAYGDVSAFCTPFRKAYFKAIRELPSDYILFGSDFPTPAFELSADFDEMEKDFKAVLDGQLDRVIIPEDNLLDVNRRELSNAFPGHSMFTNFERLI